MANLTESELLLAAPASHQSNVIQMCTIFWVYISRI